MDEDISFLERAQNELMDDLVQVPFWWARDRYLSAVRMLGVTTELAETVQNPVFPLDVLRKLYDYVAEHYRDEHDSIGQQLQLSLDGLTQEQRIAKEWCRFFLEEIQALTANESLVVPLLLSVMREKGSELGAMEGYLLNFVASRYTERTCTRCLKMQGSISSLDEQATQLISKRGWPSGMVGRS